MDIKKVFNFIIRHKKEFLAGLAFLLMYTPTFLWMWDRWFVRDSYYTHGILIPFVSAFLIWQKREALMRVARESSPLGIRLIIIGAAIHLVSSFFRVYFSSGFSMLIVLTGLILHFYGIKVFKAVIFPLGFLIFMIPVPLVVITNISFKLKLLAAHIATYILNHIRIPAYCEGSLIRMQHTNIMVDDVCSGLRSLISLTALGSIVAYWMKGGAIKKGVLFLSTIPIAIITNVVRIIFLAFIAEVWGAKYAVGFVHDFSGFLVFALAYVLLFIVARLLE